MKIIRIFLSVFISIFLFIACHNTDKKAESDQAEAKTAVEMAQKNASTSQVTTLKTEENLSGEVQYLTEEQFVGMITEINNPKGFQYKGTTPCIVDFYADWCRPCLSMNPIFKELAAQYKGKLLSIKLILTSLLPLPKLLKLKIFLPLFFLSLMLCLLSW